MKKFIIKIIDMYKKVVSPWIESRGVHCKYYPTCSQYARQAVEKYGVVKGGMISIKRFLKCNPFSKGGYDPLK